MTGRLFLSHDLAIDTPVYRTNPPVECRPEREISRGDTCNTAMLRLHNHSGTHLDAPRHFDAAGRTITDLSPDDLVFDRVALFDVPASPGELIGPERLAETRGRVERADLVLLRTRFEHWRGQPLYVEDNPGLAAELADWVREAGPSVRAVGIDSVSISAARHREEGRRAHRQFLAPQQGRPLLLVEDMALARATGDIRRVWIVPLRVRQADGAPCTVVAELADPGTSE